MSKPLVYIENGNFYYTKLFVDNGFAVIDDLSQAQLVCFTGGEDVSPNLYGEEKHPLTFFSRYRDEGEKKIFNYCVEKNIPMVGVCRGGQFLNVMSGGKMYQHVNRHTKDHYLIDAESGDSILVSSTHHQMMRMGVGGQLVAYALEGGFKEHMQEGELNVVLDEAKDTEVVFYPTTNALCFQPHPEFLSAEYRDMKDYFFALLSKFFDLKGQ